MVDWSRYSPEEIEKMRRVAEQRRAARANFQQLGAIDREVKGISEGTAGAVDYTVSRALEKTRPPDEMLAAPPIVGNPLSQWQSPEHNAVELRRARETGWNDPSIRSLPRDIEEAKRQNPNAVELAAADRRVLVSGDASARALAAEPTFPSLPEHWDAFWQSPGAASGLGVAVNALQTPARTVAGASEAIRGTDPNVGAFAAGEGGRTRGSGFGYTFAKAGDRVRESTANPTIRDLVREVAPDNPVSEKGAELLYRGGVGLFDLITTPFDAYWATVGGVDPEFVQADSVGEKYAIDKPLPPKSDPLYDVAGETVAAVVDPLNFVPFVGPVAKVAGKIGGRVLDTVPGARAATNAVTQSRPAQALKHAVMTPWFDSDAALAHRTRKTEGIEGANAISDTMHDVKLHTRALDMIEKDRAHRVLEQLRRDFSEKELVAARQMIEGGQGVAPIAHRPKQHIAADVADALQRNPELLQAVPDPDLRRRLKLARGVAEGRGPEFDDAFDAYRAASALTDAGHPIRILDNAPAGRVGMAAERMALEMGLDADRLKRARVLRPDVKVEGKFPHAPVSTIPFVQGLGNYPRVQKAARAVSEAVLGPDYNRASYNPLAARQMAENNYRSALKVQVQRLVDSMTPTWKAERLEARTALNQAKRGVDDGLREAKRWMREARRAPAGSPYRDHAMKKADELLGNVEQMRSAIRENTGVLERNHSKSALLRGFLRGDREAVERIGDVEKLLERLARHPNASAELPTRLADTIDVMDPLLGERLSKTPEFQADPVRALAQYKSAISPEAVRHELQLKMLTDVLDERGNRVFQTLEDALVSPRRGEAFRLPEFFEPSGPNMGKLRKNMLTVERIREGRVVAELHEDVLKHLREKGLALVDGKAAEHFPALRNRVAPAEVIKDLEELGPKTTSQGFNLAMDVLNRVSSAWMIPIQLATPGFNARNAFFGMFQAWLATGHRIGDARTWHLAGELARAAEKPAMLRKAKGTGIGNYSAADLVHELRRWGVWEGGRVADLERAVLSVPNTRIGAAAKTMLRADKAIGRGIGKTISLGGGAATAENVQRAFVFLTELRRGKTPAQAARTVRKYMFDYTGAYLRPWEKTLRKMLPFWQWIRQSNQLVLSTMLTQPHKYAQANRLYMMIDAASREPEANVDPRTIPASVGELGMIAAPGFTDTPDLLHFATLERPGSQLQWASRLPSDPIAGPLSYLAEQVAPGLKIPYELATGEYLYGDMPLDPSYKEEGASSYTPTERMFKMRSERPGEVPLNLPLYAARAIGTNVGIPVDMLLSEFAPEYGSGAVRRSGQSTDAQSLMRMSSWALGPRGTTVVPADVRARARTERKAFRDSNRAVQQTAARRRTAESPTEKLGRWVDKLLEDDR